MKINQTRRLSAWEFVERGNARVRNQADFSNTLTTGFLNGVLGAQNNAANGTYQLTMQRGLQVVQARAAERQTQLNRLI